jgi:adenylate cyclase
MFGGFARGSGIGGPYTWFLERLSAMTLEYSKICRGCWQQLKLPIPLRGPLSGPFRMFGIRPSRMNPNTCTICEMAFTKIMRARSITTDVTVMFADLRGYTALTQDWPVERVSALLDTFYDECAAAIWKYDGLLNKTLGDAVLAIFNFPVRRLDHATRAVLAAREIQEHCLDWNADIVQRFGSGEVKIGVGIGIDSGDTNFGEFGRSHRDLTVIGTVVNRAARAQAAAQPGEILVTETVRARTGSMVTGSGHDYTLKGFSTSVTLFSAL